MTATYLDGDTRVCRRHRGHRELFDTPPTASAIGYGPRAHAPAASAGTIHDVSERLRAIVAQLELQPDDDVLEIGCGHGVASTLVCEQLAHGTGHLTAIDRSAKMIAAATKRNLAYVHAGRAEFRVTRLENLAVVLEEDDRRFDVVFAVRVGLFHREPTKARALAEPWLKPTGRLHAFFDPPARTP